MRCDVNLSLMPKGTEVFGTRSETKNVNSLRSVERAVRYEVGRHAAVLSSGGTIVQETRHWHEDTGVTTSGRAKSSPWRPCYCSSCGSASSRRRSSVCSKPASGTCWSKPANPP